MRCDICDNIHQARNDAQGQSWQYINIQHPSKIHNLFSINILPWIKKTGKHDSQ